MVRHDLKCSSAEFKAMVEGVLNFQLRLNDRDFKVGDELILHEINDDVSYTGDQFCCKVMYIIHGGNAFGGLLAGWCIMSVFGGFLMQGGRNAARPEATSTPKTEAPASQ